MASNLLPFPQLLFQRLRKALTRLALETWSEPVDLVVERTRSRRGAFPLSEAQREPLRSVSLPCVWEAEGYSTTWFKVSLPKGFRPRPDDYFYWEDNAEATAYRDGHPVFGLDCTHRRWPWPKGARTLWLESVFCQTGIWHASAKGIGPAGSLLASARLVRKNADAWNAYFDLETLVDWLEDEVRRALPHEVADKIVVGARSWPEMDTAGAGISPDGVGTGVQNRHRPEPDQLPPIVRKVFAELSEAVRVYHERGAGALRKRLQQTYRILRESAAFRPKAVVTGNSHLDLVWLWPEAVGERKAARSFASVLHLLENNPDFRFNYTQPASYEAIARSHPDLFARVQRQIKRGGWEALGGGYVESDTLLPCGEALLRSLTIGQEIFAKLRGGKPNRVLWLPDDFGFAGCLPALMRMAGLDFFYSTKLAWNMVNAFPHSSFVWRGCDGSEVLAHFSLRTGYNNPARTRNLRLEAEADRQIVEHPEFIFPTGWGDGAGGPTQDIIERVRRQKNLRNMPSAQFGSVEDFFVRLAKARGRLPVHDGEIYMEAHRGTYSTHGYMKAAFRAAETALRTLEAAAALNGGAPVDEKAWRRLVFTQFHDCIPGSSTQEVYDEIVPELKTIAADSLNAARGAFGEKGGVLAFNPLPLSLPYRHTGRTVALPPLSASAPESLPSAACAKVSASARALGNGRVSAAFDARGALVRLSVDGRELLSAPVAPVVYTDVPYDLEAWEIDRDAMETGRTPELIGLGKPEKGDGWVGLRQTWRTRGGSSIGILWRVREGGVALEAEIAADWREKETLLRLEMPTAFRGSHALFGAPYGGVWRPQESGDARASAMWEVPASRWAMSASHARDEGAFIVGENKYGFACHDGKLSVTLLRSAKITVPNGFPERFRGRKNLPQWSDLGKQTIRLALGALGRETPREEMPAALADTLFAMPLRVKGAPHALPLAFEGLPSAVPAWVAPLGRGRFIVRLHETLGRSGALRAVVPNGWKVARLARAFPDGSEKPLKNGALKVGAFSIVSLLYFK